MSEEKCVNCNRVMILAEQGDRHDDFLGIHHCRKKDEVQKHGE